MALGLLAHDQGIKATPGQGGLQGHGTHQGIGPEGEAGHRHRLGLNQSQQVAPQQRQAHPTEAHRLAVHVVIALAPGGQGEAAVAVGTLRQQLEQVVPPGGGAFGKGGHAGR